jgi:hypothetical protein
MSDPLTGNETTYTVLLRFCEEGPFSETELRERLHSGKARSDDRIIDSAGNSMLLADLIPNAQEISRQRAAVSNRVRRTSRERRVAGDITAAARLRTPSAGTPETAPPAEAQIAAEPLVHGPATHDHDHPRPPLPVRRRPFSRRLGVAFLATCVASLWYWFPHSQESLPTLFPPPVIAPLTLAELDSLPEDRLLARISEECSRRIFAARRGWQVGTEVLPPSAYPLWVVGIVEPFLLYHGLQICIDEERVPGTPSAPSLVELANAYSVIGNTEAAEIIHEALKIAVPTDPSPEASADPYAALQTRLERVLGKGTEDQRLRYAVTRRQTLFIDLP